MGNRLSRIYTRTGDDGTTGLGDGSRTTKDGARIEAIGAVDELNSTLGVLLAEPLGDDVHKLLTDVQHDLFDLGLADGFLAFAGRQNALRGTRLVNDVDRLVGQVAVVDVLGAEFSSRLQSRHRIFDAVVLFKARFEAFENLNRLLHRGLNYIDFLKAA